MPRVHPPSACVPAVRTPSERKVLRVCGRCVCVPKPDNGPFYKSTCFNPDTYSRELLSTKGW